MPHDPTCVKLRGGSANPRNPKLYHWQELGALVISSGDSGSGLEAVQLDRGLVIHDSGISSETVLKLKAVAITVTEDGSGTDTEAIFRKAVQLKAIESALEFHRGAFSKFDPIQGILRVHATVVDEGRLSVSGDPDRLAGGYIHPIGYIGNLRRAQASETHPVEPRLGSAQKTPRSWSQGHRNWTLRLYTLGRNSILEGLTDEDGKSTTFDLLDIRCLDKEGNPSNIFAEDCLIAGVEAILQDGDDSVYLYTIRCSRYTMTPMMHLLKMTLKPIGSPLTITLIHPEVHQVTSEHVFYLSPDYKAVFDPPSSELMFFPEQSWEDAKEPSFAKSYFDYDGHIWLLSAVANPYGSLDFAGWVAVTGGLGKSVTAAANTGAGYVVGSGTPFIFDGGGGYGSMGEDGVASYTVPMQSFESAHQIDCLYCLGWGIYANNTTSNGYRFVSSGSGIGAGSYTSSINPPSGYHVEWYLDGLYLGRGSQSPLIPAQTNGTYHILESIQVAN